MHSPESDSLNTASNCFYDIQMALSYEIRPFSYVSPSPIDTGHICGIAKDEANEASD